MKFTCFVQQLELILERLQKVFPREIPLRLLLCGDPMQLPPVGGSVLYDSRLTVGHDFWQKFNFCIELTTPMRQNDILFQELLARLRTSRCTDVDLDFLLSKQHWNVQQLRTLHTSLSQFLQQYTFIAGYKLHVAVINAVCQTLNSIVSDSQIIKSSSRNRNSRNRDGVAEMRDALFGVSNYDLEIKRKELFLAVGDRVVVTQNLSTAEGIVNGSRGVLKFFVFASPENLIDSSPPLAVGVQFEDKQDQIILIPSKSSVEFDEGVQIPLQLSYAQTVHKLQGATLNGAVIDYESLLWQDRLTYVAVSRVTSASGLLALPVQAINRFKRHKCFRSGVSPLLQAELTKNTQLHQTTEEYFIINKL